MHLKKKNFQNIRKEEGDFQHKINLSDRKNNNLTASNNQPELTFNNTDNINVIPYAENEHRKNLHLGGEKYTYPFLQTKLKVNKPGDKYEQEADRIAEEVTNSDSSFIQRSSCSSCQKEDDTEEIIQTKSITNQITPLIQRQEDDESDEEEILDEEENEEVMMKSMGAGNTEITSSVSNQINSTRGQGSLMPEMTKNFMENSFGTDFSRVRIHHNQQATNLNRKLNSRAFTLGNDIYFNSGQYNPNQKEGKKLLAHELTHVVQQNHNNKIEIQRKRWGPCPKKRRTDGRIWMINKAAELIAVFHAKRTLKGHSVISNEELASDMILTRLPRREQIIYNKLKKGFHRDRTPRRRRRVDPLNPDITQRPESNPLQSAYEFVQALLEPDIIDLTNQTIYDVTTDKQRHNKRRKLASVYLPWLKTATGLTWRMGTILKPITPLYVRLWPTKYSICFGPTDFNRFPGVIQYIPYGPKRKDKKKRKSKSRKSSKSKKTNQGKQSKSGKTVGAYNFGLGISLFSSGGGAGNVGFGVSIMSNGASVGTVSAGIVYNSDGVAVGTVSTGMSKYSMSAGALSAGAGKSEGDISAAALMAGAGTSKDNVVAAAAGAGTGNVDGQMEAQAGETGKSDIKGKQPNNAEMEKAVQQAGEVDKLLQKASPAQRKLLTKIIQKQQGNVYDVPDSQWVRQFLETTHGISEAEAEKLADSINWTPGGVFQRNIKSGKANSSGSKSGDQVNPSDKAPGAQLNLHSNAQKVYMHILSKKGIKITQEAQKLNLIIPKDFTKEQMTELERRLSQLKQSDQATIETVLKALSLIVKEIKEGKSPAGQPVLSDSTGKKKPGTTPDPTRSRDTKSSPENTRRSIPKPKENLASKIPVMTFVKKDERSNLMSKKEITDSNNLIYTFNENLAVNIDKLDINIVNRRLNIGGKDKDVQVVSISLNVTVSKAVGDNNSYGTGDKFSWNSEMYNVPSTGNTYLLKKGQYEYKVDELTEISNDRVALKSGVLNSIKNLGEVEARIIGIKNIESAGSGNSKMYSYEVNVVPTRIIQPGISLIVNNKVTPFAVNVPIRILLIKTTSNQ